MSTDQQTEYDVIVIGAGHNGLASATVLADKGLKVLVLEKNNYVGGMAGTREILKGCRNEVGASCLFPMSQKIIDDFNFEHYGVEFIDLPVMAINMAGTGNKPVIFYSNMLRQIFHIVCRHGLGAMLGFAKLVKFCEYPASVMDRFTPHGTPRSLQQLLEEAPDEKSRKQLELTFSGSAMDLIDRFFPDKNKHRSLRSLLAFAAIQSTYKGPYSKGSALCLVYTMAQDGSGGLMRRVRGGLGVMSDALCQSFKEKGGDIRLKTSVQTIAVEKECATGVVLKNGEKLTAKVVLSNLDKPATFFHLLEEGNLAEDTVNKVRKIEHQGAWMHMLFKLKALPEYGREWASLNKDVHLRFGGAMVHDPELMQASFECCDRGELPEHIPVAFQIPTIMDPSLAPTGYHIANAFAFYFPSKAPKEQLRNLRDQFTERVLDQICEYMPNFRDCIIDQAIFSSDHFASMHGATKGDFTHGLIHPEQMLKGRTLIDGSAHATPVKNLYLCGSSCHPGPGLTFIPGYNCGHEVFEKVFSR